MSALVRRPLAVLVAIACALPALADERSEAAAAELLHRRLKHEAPEDARLLEAVAGRDVVVVRGSMDRIEDVLRAARIRHTVLEPSQVAAADLRASQVVMVNCPGTMPAAGIARLEKFVRAGGLLYTTDWALLNVVQKAFPGTVAHNGGSTDDEVVPVAIEAEDDNLMSRMLLRKKSAPQWWLEGGSYPIRILDAKRVKVLARSSRMGKKYGAAPIVVRFRWHDGEVVHVVSHFVRQLATQGPAVAAKDAVKEFEGLSEDDRKAFAKSGAAGASAGDVESSYAFQAMTANLVVGKQKRNVELDRQYGLTVAAPVALAETPSAAPPKADAAPESRRVSKGAKLRVLSEKEGKVQVRDDAGNEGWLDKDVLIAR